MELLQSQNFLIWIYECLYHWQTNHYLLHYNSNLTELFIALCRINRIYFFCVHVCSNPCVGSLPKIKTYFLLLSIFVNELISTEKIIKFLPNSVPGNEKLLCLSNPIRYLEYLYLSVLAFLGKLTAPNKQFSSFGSLLVFTIFPWSYVILPCFKQLPLNRTLVLVPE